MNTGDRKLVQTLVERLVTKLPHRTGVDIEDIREDTLVVLTRDTLVEYSRTVIVDVIDALVPLLDDLHKLSRVSRYNEDYVRRSEVYLLELLAACCEASWDSARNGTQATPRHGRTDSVNSVSKQSQSGLDSISILSDATTLTAGNMGLSQFDSHRTDIETDSTGLDGLAARRHVVPSALDDTQAQLLLDYVIYLISPLPDDFELPSSWLLDGEIRAYPDSMDNSGREPSKNKMKNLLDDLGRSSSVIIGYLSAANWSVVFNCFQNKLRHLRAVKTNPVNGANNQGQEEDANRETLSALQIMVYLHLDGQQLSLILQELSGCFLNLRKDAQSVIAVLLPGTISRWMKSSPTEFLGLHSTTNKSIQGADVLFDMANSITDDRARRKGVVWPMQMALVFLVPEAFWVAANMRDAKSGQVAKKAAFLESLRNSLASPRNNHAALFCLVWLCQAATRFSFESESALYSYAVDLQTDVRRSVLQFTEMGSVDHLPDRDMLVASIVALAQLDPDPICEAAPRMLNVNSPIALRIGLVGACSVLALQEDSSRFEPLFELLAPFLRIHCTAGELTSPDLMRAVLDFCSIKPKTIELISDPDDETFALWSASPYQTLNALVAGDDEGLRSRAGVVYRHLLNSETLRYLQKDTVGSTAYFSELFESSAGMITNLSNKLLQLESDNKEVNSIVSFILDYLTLRLKALKVASEDDLQQIVSISAAIPDRSRGAAALEVACLVLLCSVPLEICSKITSTLDTYCQCGTFMENLEDLARSPIGLMRNYEAYTELSSPDFYLTGPVAFQKRFRKILMKMNRPTAGILTAWETALIRWQAISHQLVANQLTITSTEEDSIFSEWRNYSGFLAALGGCCISELSLGQRGDDPLVAGLRWIDRTNIDGSEPSLLDQFIKQCLQLLTCSHVRVREAMRDVLGTELSLRLYPQLFHALQADLNAVFHNAPQAGTKPSVSDTISVEQAASLVRTVVERLDDFHETFFSVDLGSLLLNLAKHLQTLRPDNTTLRVKVRFCQLCEVVTRKKEMLNFRYDVRIRNNLVEILLGWISRPGAPRSEVTFANRTRHDEAARLQWDLDRACLKTLADVTYRLPLQPLDGPTDAETSDVRSQLFQSYFSRLLLLLRDDSTDLDRRKALPSGSIARDETFLIPEMAITVLSNMLSANIDVGLKQSLEAGYHEDIEVRTAFVRVLCNILNQGTEFGSLSDSAISEKYDELLELIIDDMDLIVAICDSCPSGEVDEITVSLLNIFDSRGMGFDLLGALISQEVANTENESELLRRNCVATKMLSVYAKWKGSEYLKTTLQEVLRRLIMSSDKLDLELDPARITSPEELQRNALQLQLVTKVFIDDICHSTDKIPHSFRRICNTIMTAVTPRFPEAKYTAVGAFIFLRFFCPAIVAPDSEGLISAPPSKDMRRGLLLIAKVVQNLANNVLFGIKEPYMLAINDFLTHNIYRITAFLKDISSPPKTIEPSTPIESFDFGSCVALHGFFYEHWETVRHKLLMKGKVPWKVVDGATNVDSRKYKQSSLEHMSELISSLGMPPQDLSWTRPQISANMPPAYSRFQHFMLKNSGKNIESVISARAVYDGGESKDALPVICIILRNIEMDGMDYDLLLYCYLKIASRMWHRPFGILIDATCCNSLAEPPDEIFRRLDSLTPTEMSKRLSRVYVYNMNSSYRKCFRRVLRLAARNETSSFHPNNVDYYLIGSLQDLQVHFHLGSLHLPKDTISVVTDSRFVYQPVTRVSKTKGQIEVIIKVGSQYVQVTTAKKQEVIAGLRLNATVNDIFRLSDIEETNPSFQLEDETAFGFRTENGKIVMYFTSPKKNDILQAVRTAKTKQGNDAKPTRLIERLIRPEDVPGTLLNISLTNMAYSDQKLRLASYNLLCSLCRAFRFTLDKSFVGNKDLTIPADSAPLIVGISQCIAASEPQLTNDFLLEFFVGWERCPADQRLLNVMFMVPWLPNLWDFVLCQDSDGERGSQRVGVIARKLIDLAMREPNLRTWFQEEVWPVVGKSDLMIELFLDQMIKVAQLAGPDSDKIEVVAGIAASMGGILARGKIIARLRKALNKSSLRPTKRLVDNACWNEISVLLRLCLAVSFNSRVQVQLFLPELFHCITLLINSGSQSSKAATHALLINSIHAICTSLPLDEASISKLKSSMTTISENTDHLTTPLAPKTRSASDSQDSFTLVSLENATQTLLDIMATGAPSLDIANAWRSRWMSLVASTAFQSNPALQARAFGVMGFLIKEEVDDDLLYQVLVALRNSMARYTEEGESDMLLAILGTLTKIMSHLAPTSRYLLQLYWLAMSFVRLMPKELYRMSTSFLEAALQAIATAIMNKTRRMVPVLMQGRIPIEEALVEIDDHCGIPFKQETFHIASSACLIKGLTDLTTKPTALRVLSTFLEIGSASAPDSSRFPDDLSLLPYIGVVVARATSAEESREILWLAGVTLWIAGVTPPTAETSFADVFRMVDMSNLKDKDLLLNTVLGLIDFKLCEFEVQQRMLYFLARLATQRPQVMVHLYDLVRGLLDDILRSTQSPGTLKAAHRLTRALSANPNFAIHAKSAGDLQEVLDGMGFGGLWKSSEFEGVSNRQKCGEMIDKLIELIIA